MSRQQCEALLVDLDGVLRVFDDGHLSAVEERHGLPSGAIETAAFAPELLRQVVTGGISHDEWLDAIAKALSGAGATSTGTEPVTEPVTGPVTGHVSESVAAAAVAEWAADRGAVQPDVLDTVRQVRATGVPVAIVSNATDWLDADLERLGLRDEVDAVVNSSVVGHAKPSAEFFAAACRAVGVPPSRCFFVDDEARNVAGARAAGLAAHRYTGPADLRYVRSAVARPRQPSP